MLKTSTKSNKRFISPLPVTIVDFSAVHFECCAEQFG